MEDALTRIRAQTRQALVSLAWLVAAAAIALGAAGVVAGMDAPAADGTDRTGRTMRGDAQADQALDRIEGDMRTLSWSIDGLGQQARGILAALSGNDTVPADEATAIGTGLVSDIEAQAASIRSALDEVPMLHTPAATYAISAATRDRHATYLRGLGAIAGIRDAWTRLTIGSLSASRLSRLLADHDEAVANAAEAGRDGDYATALMELQVADDAIADARVLRDRLAATIDVETLTEWLERSAAYDVALRALYVAVTESGGQATPAVRAAIAAEEAAQARLPPDTRALVLIMSDIGRGGLNASAIEIDQARADLDEALSSPLAAPAP